MRERLENSLATPVLLAAAIYTITALGRVIIDADEGVYAYIPQQMLASGNWLTPYVNGVRSIDKPPLLYWLIASFYSLFGVSAFVARLPAILGVTGTSYLCGLIARREATPRAGVYAASVFAFSAGTFLFTLEVMHDILLVFFLTLAILMFVRILESPGLLSVVGFFAALGGAFMAKSLVGVAFGIGIAVIYMAATREIPRLRAWWLLVGMAVFAVIALPWPIAMEIANPGFLRIHFFEEQVLRFFNKREPVDYESVPLLLFWALIPVWAFPWSAFLPAVFGLKKTRITRLAAIWFGLILVFFSVSSRLEHYAFPLLASLAVLTGQALAAGGPRLRTGYRILTVVGVLLVVVGVVLAGAMITGYGVPSGNADHADVVHNNDFSIMQDFSGDLIAELMKPAVAATLLMGLCFLAARRAGVAAVVAGVMVLQLSAADSMRTVRDVISSSQFGRELAQVAEPGSRLYVVGDYESANSINFYAPVQIVVVDGGAASLGPGLRYPDAPKLDISTAELREAWSGVDRCHLLVEEARLPELDLKPVFEVFRNSGRVLVTNQPPDGALPAEPR